MFASKSGTVCQMLALVLLGGGRWEMAHGWAPSGFKKVPFCSKTTKEHAASSNVAASILLGWALVMTPLVPSATAMDTPNDPYQQAQPSITLAAGAYIPDESFSSMDLSMPSYRVDNDVLGGGSSSSSSKAPSPTPTKQKTSRSSKVNPEKEAARLAAAQAKAEQQAAAKKAKEAADLQRKIDALEKMAAKKAERAAFQNRRNS